MRRKIGLCYRDELGRETRRTVWPVKVAYLETVRHLAAWCELRQDFRTRSGGLVCLQPTYTP